ncbi:30S ribosomal protein THX [Cellulophaga sp. HaHaR_3_176]|nr:30S ribosomal protein THX [Cellulophaga sp. HaHaR_3_176]QWX84395.1 30S ribosomal protein THX [Cellulophaga sp. HaHaR_3_176]
MGKGDKKSKKGKIFNNSFGAKRPRKIKKRPTVEEKLNIKKKQ